MRVFHPELKQLIQETMTEQERKVNKTMGSEKPAYCVEVAQ